MIYLDNAATTLKKPLSLYPAVLKNTIINSANAGRGGHFYSVRASEGIYETAEAISTLFNIPSPEQLAFTPNATYALNYAILGLLSRDSHAIITQMEHNSVLRPIHKSCDYTVIKADRHGNIRLTDIKKSIRKNTKLIVCTHASNVCGTIMPIEQIGKLSRSHGIPFLVDAAQSAGSIPIDVEKLCIDLLAFSGHKGLMTPMGVGGLYVREGIKLNPIITGGTGSLSQSLTQPDFMPDILHNGTLNAPAIISAKKSVDFILKQTPQEIGKKEHFLASRLFENLKNMDNVTAYGSFEKGNHNGTVAFNVYDYDSVHTSEILNDKFKICTRGGWHCAYPAHQALGTEKKGAVRASFGFFNSVSDVAKLTDAIYFISKNKSFF